MLTSNRLSTIGTFFQTKSINQYNSTFNIDLLPDELFLQIFGFLSPKALCRMELVSRRWKNLASDHFLWEAFDLKKLHPKLKTFGGDDWNHYVDLQALEIKIEDEPKLDKRKLIPLLLELSDAEWIEGKKGITLFMIPEGISLEKLRTIAMYPKQGNSILIEYYSFDNSDLRSVPSDSFNVQKTFWVIMTNSLIKGSRNTSKLNGRKLIKKYDLELPTLLLAVTHNVISMISSNSLKDSLYHDKHNTFTVCQNLFLDYKVSVGYDSPFWLHDSPDINDYSLHIIKSSKHSQSICGFTGKWDVEASTITSTLTKIRKEKKICNTCVLC